MDSSAESADGKGLRHFRYIAAGVVLLLLIASVVAYGGGGSDDRSTSSPNRSVPPVRVANASAFVDSIGVNTHLYYTNTAYSNYPLVKQRLRELGIRHIRDGFDGARRQFWYDRVNDLGASGFKFTLGTCRLVPGGWEGLDQDISDAKNKVRGAVEALEGTNEANIRGYSDWANMTRRCQWWLNELTRNRDDYGPRMNIPIYAPTVTVPSVSERYRELGNLEDRAQGGNMHPYPGGVEPRHEGHYSFIDSMSDSRRFGFGGRQVPVVATETGYHNATAGNHEHPPVSERAAGIYVPRLLLEYFRHGVQRTYLYELVDEKPDAGGTDPEQHFGLLRNDFSPKPAYLALKNLIRLLGGGPGKRITGSLRYRLEGDTEGIEQLLLKKRDGSFYLALWQSASVFDIERSQDLRPPARAVTVRLEQSVALAQRYRPGKSSSPLTRHANTSAIRLSVPADVVVVRLDPR